MYKDLRNYESDSRGWDGQMIPYTMGYHCGKTLQQVDPSFADRKEQEEWLMGYRDAVGDLGFSELAEAHRRGDSPGILEFMLKIAQASSR